MNQCFLLPEFQSHIELLVYNLESAEPTNLQPSTLAIIISLFKDLQTPGILSIFYHLLQDTIAVLVTPN